MRNYRNPRWLLKDDHTFGPHQLCNRAQSCNRIGKVHQNEAAYRRIEWLLVHDQIHIRLYEGNVLKAGFPQASSRLANGFTVPFNCHNLSRRTDQSGYQHGHIPYTRPKIQNTLSGPYARFTKKSFGDGRDTCSLPDQTLMLSVGMAQRVNSRAMA